MSTGSEVIGTPDRAAVAVLGASGKTGRAVTAALVRSGVEVRAVVRRAGRMTGVAAAGGGAGPSATAETGSAVGSSVHESVADLDTGVGLVEAMAGCEAVYLIAPNVHPDEPGLIARALDAANRAGVGRAVLHSVLHPHDSMMPHHLGKAAAEEVLRSSGSEWTVLQPCAYTQNLTSDLSQVLARGVLSVPYRTDRPVTLVDLDDVAQVAAEVLLHPGHEGASYELCGPEAVTVEQVAVTLSELSGVRVGAVRQDPDEWSRGPGADLPGYAHDALRAMFACYDVHGLVGGRTVLPWLLGRPSAPVSVSIARALASC